MKRLGRDAAELTALADHLTAHGLVLEMLAGPLPGLYDPSGPGRLLFAFFAAMGETERDPSSTVGRHASVRNLLVDVAAPVDGHDSPHLHARGHLGVSQLSPRKTFPSVER